MQFTVLTFMRPILVLFWWCVFSFSISAQISYGGAPLPLSSQARAASSVDLFVDMPPLNSMEALRKAETQPRAAFRSLTFAHKFYTHLRPDNSGVSFTGPDGARVWRVGIRSKGAYSLNILFTKYRVPRGAKVFVYNADQTEILGSYTEQNNTDLNLLPIQPIRGDELIVEYHEPIGADFKGELEVGEVNHDFRGLFGIVEPRDPMQKCHPNIVCYPEDMEAGRGVLALIINGTTYCTGSLVNNTAEDGTPYLLTATHCLNHDYDYQFLRNRRYDFIAGTLVVFFNYNSPICSDDIRGPVQMTMASADSVLINEKHDISLLKLKQKPPVHYQPYYLGWDVSRNPTGEFHGLHHPNGGVKKVAIEKDELTITTFGAEAPYNMQPQSHWAVRAWDVGATEGGSSGSPLLDKGKRIVGTLTGGESYCSSPKGPDVYASLYKAWNVTESLGNPNSLKTYLDPSNSATFQLSGYNPFLKTPYTRVRNYNTNEEPEQTKHNTIPLFATNNTMGYVEFGEEFNLSEETLLSGVFISSPPIQQIETMDVNVRVYAGDTYPTRLLHEQKHTYRCRYYENHSFHEGNRNSGFRTENYIHFSAPVKVPKRFYVTYSEANDVANGFSALNIVPRSAKSTSPCLTWMKSGSEWIKANKNAENPINTSLMIVPYTISSNLQVIDPGAKGLQVQAYYNHEVKRIFVKANREIDKWELFYVTGQKVHEGNSDKNTMQLSYPAAHLIHGMYIVRVSTADGKKSVKILVR